MEVYDFGLRVKRLRENQNLTQQELGEKIGVSRNIISRYEANTANPKINTLTRLVLVLDTSAD